MWIFLGFCIYIGRKWFGLWICIWVLCWIKVLILVGFYDIGCDIGVFGVDGWEVGILLGLVGFCLWVLFLSLCRDELAYVLQEKLVLPNGF